VALSAWKTLVDARLEALGCTAASLFGGEHLRAHAAPPRLVWVPVGGPGGPPVKTSHLQRSLRTLSASVECYIWAATYDDAEALLQFVVAAVHQTSVGSYDLERVDWPETDKSLDVCGKALVARFRIDLPLLEPAPQTATVETIDLTATIPAP
jgi:hypothetical protein